MAFTPRRLMRGASGAGGYKISRSLRFNTADSAYLVRVPATTTNRRTWTWSAWVKRSEITPYQSIFSSNDNTLGIAFGGDQQWQVFFDVGVYAVNTAAVFRDPSAWYHLVVGVDTTQATAANRVKMYVNGTQVTTFATTPAYPPQNFDTAVNQNTNHRIGAGPTYASNWFGGYQADVYLIDGQQLTPSSFGETDIQTGVWKPKAYSGSYGTNGFFVNFSDNSGATATTLGKDYSGNGNNFTPTNLSVTAGSGNDSFVDSPTLYGTDTGVGGTVRGNYATINPLQLIANVSVSNGNLYLQSNNNADQFASAPSTIAARTGKWYAEYTCVAAAGAPTYVFGVARASWSPIILDGGGYYGRWWYASEGYAYLSSNGGFYSSPSPGSNGATFANGDIIGVAMDLDAGSITFYKNGVSQGTPFTSIPLGVDYIFAGGAFTTPYPTPTNIGAYFANFGQRPFAYTAPSGFRALNTQNLPTPTIGATPATQAGKFFNPVLYTGNGTTNNITGVGFQPDWTWLKARSTPATAGNHFATDVVRGAGIGLYPNLTDAEANNTSLFTGFTSNGFNVAGTNGSINENGVTYVAWNWKAGGTAVTNTSGSISSQVSASPASGFSIATWTANGGNATVGHGLGVAPAMVIYKSRGSVGSWVVFHKSLTNMTTTWLKLHTADAEITGPFSLGGAPTSTVFYADSNFGSGTTVTYSFAEIEGFSKISSYTGNGSADGTFVYCGFRPAFLMIKNASVGYDWWMFDDTRSPSNAVNKYLSPDSSAAENTADVLDFTANGFKIRNSGNGFNASGNKIIFAAFAEFPTKYSLAR
jgi:hypothetical protein